MDEDPQPYGSWGNGAAMRISPVGLWATIAAIAGGIAETLHGIPNAIAIQAWVYPPKGCRAKPLGP